MFENLRYGIEISVSKIYFKIVKRIFMNCWPCFFMIETHLVLRCMSWNIFMYCTGSRFWIFTLYNFTIIKNYLTILILKDKWHQLGQGKHRIKNLNVQDFYLKPFSKMKCIYHFSQGPRYVNLENKFEGKSPNTVPLTHTHVHLLSLVRCVQYFTKMYFLWRKKATTCQFFNISYAQNWRTVIIGD